MSSTYKAFVDKMGGTSVNTYIGSTGELFYDPSTTTLRISDGSTPGGTVIGSGSSFDQTLNTTDTVQFAKIEADIATTTISVLGTNSEESLSIENDSDNGVIVIKSDAIRIGDTEDTSEIFIGQHNVNNTTLTNFYGDFVFRERDIEFRGSDITFAVLNETKASTIDFANAVITNWEDPNTVNKHDGSVAIAVGGQTATFDDLTIRLEDNGGSLDVAFNYDPTISPSSISANGDSSNIFNGITTVTGGNTTWTVLNTLNAVGDKGDFTIVDQSSHKIYRGTVIARSLPDVGVVGDAYCVIERIL